MRTGLVMLMLATLTLSGCAGNDEGPLETMAEPQTTIANPEAVSISEQHDLSLGMSTTTWSFTVGEATHSDVRFELTGVEGTPVGYAPEFCFTYETPNGAGSQCPGPGNVNVQVSVLFGRVLYEDQNLTPGQYSFTFSSLPALAELIVDANVHYA